MELALKEILKKNIQPILKTMGFTKKGNCFYKKNNGFIYAIYVPIDREYTENGAYFTVQFGMYSEALETMLGREIKAFPQGYDFILNSNVLTHCNTENDRYLLESTTNLTVFGENMKNDVVQTLAFFDQITTVETFMDYCLAHNYLVHHEDLLRYLAIKKDEEKTAFYLSKIKEKLQQIADRAYGFYAKKLEDLKKDL